MRQIKDYERAYSIQSFEEIQVRFRRKLVLEQIEKYKPQNILEIGCGYEPLFQYVQNMKVTIVEPSEQFMQHAKELAAALKKEVTFVQGFFEESVDQLNKDYDMVFCSGLLHEVEHPEGLLKAVKEVCDGGHSTIVHINVPNANSMHRLLAQESGMIADVHDKSERNRLLQQNSVFDMESLSRLIESSGFKIIESGSYFVKPFSHDQMYQIIKAGILQETVLEGLYNIEKYMPGMGSEIFVNCRV